MKIFDLLRKLELRSKQNGVFIEIPLLLFIQIIRTINEI
jgi:hypothetical protein